MLLNGLWMDRLTLDQFDGLGDQQGDCLAPARV
jgi:hypothetical protein